MRFVWDSHKERTDRRGHGVDFDTAMQAFADPHAWSELDRIEGGEDIVRIISARQKADLAALAAMPDEAIDFTDIPELTEKFWKNARQGRFYRPLKQQLTLRLDADVVAWFKAQTPKGDGYQTHINRALRQYAMGAGAPIPAATQK